MAVSASASETAMCAAYEELREQKHIRTLDVRTLMESLGYSNPGTVIQRMVERGMLVREGNARYRFVHPDLDYRQAVALWKLAVALGDLEAYRLDLGRALRILGVEP